MGNYPDVNLRQAHDGSPPLSMPPTTIQHQAIDLGIDYGLKDSALP